MFTVLEKQIISAATAYYEGKDGSPCTVSDSEFDAMVEKQRKINPDSPVLQVGWGYIPKDRSVAHIGQRVGSLPKVQYSDIEEDWEAEKAITVEPKFDGASVVVYFVEGKIYRAVTRGDGLTGKDVTEKLKFLLRNYDTNFPYDSIRGEVVVPTAMEKVVLGIQKDNGDLYTTTRGFAAGVLNQLKTDYELLKYLEFVPYTIRNERMTKAEMFEELMEYNLIPNNYDWVAEIQRKSQLEAMYKTWGYTYPIDGVVVSPADSLNPELDSYSVKFETEVVEGTVLHLEWNTGSTGAIIPVVVLLKPVLCCGAKIQRLTGNYAGWCIDRGIDTGVVIKLTRGNEVIPKILGVVNPSRVSIPANCPTCGADTILHEGGSLMCTNDYCPAKTVEQAYKLVEISNVEKGIGKDTWFRFFDLADISDFKSFVKYLQSLQQMADDRPVTWFGVSKGSNIVNVALPAIVEKLHSLTFADILFCQNIPYMGKSYSERLGIYTFLELKDIGISETLNLGTNVNIGRAVADRLKDLISMVIELKLHPKRFDIAEGVEVCITGSLNYGTRDAFAAEILKHGFINQKSVTKNVKFLVCNDNKASSKTKAAEKNGVQVVTEAQFLKMHNITL